MQPKHIIKHKQKRRKFCVNDHIDILTEILKRLDGRSLCVAACVCRLWCTVAREDAVWENVCFRDVHPPLSSVRPIVGALGGYKKLYTVCVGPVLRRLGQLSQGRAGTFDEVQLSLSLFCIDYYEKLGRRRGDASASSLMFLCKPVNVLIP